MTPMTFSATDIQSYAFSSSDKLLVDANVWLFLYGPQYSSSRDPRVRVYSAAWKSILSAGCQVVIDVTVLSEFVNASLRYEYNKLPASLKPPDFKSFRRSALYPSVARHLAVNCNAILSHCSCVDSDFTLTSAASAIAGLAAGTLDFTDQVLVQLCGAKGFTIITHDGDYKGADVNILTFNSSLLAP